MATVNNWLAFSLSPQELPPSQTDSTLISAATTDDVSGDVCFNIPQDWSMRGSELSALVAEPKLEDFLGGISFSEQHHKANCNMVPSTSSTACYYASSGATTGYHHQLYHQPTSSALHFADSVMVASSAGVHDGAAMLSAATANGGTGAASANGGSIGLSMIKNWLRSQPAPAPAGVDSMALATTATSSPEGCRKVVDGGESAVNILMDAAQQKKASVDTFGQRTSIYRGVTKHRWTGRYEAHLWDNSCRREGQTRKGRQVYLGGYDKEEKAARAYDLAALKYWGTTTTTNFPMSNYKKELEEMKHMSRQEYVASLRRKSSGFSRGASIYRGVTRHHQHGRWQARIGRVAGNKDLYLGTFSTQEEAAEAYDIAAIKFRGLNAVTNFDMSRYDAKSIIESSSLPVGSITKRPKDGNDQSDIGLNGNCAEASGPMTATNLLTDGIGSYGPDQYGYGGLSPAAMMPISLQYSKGHGHSRLWCKQELDGAVVSAAHNLHQLQHIPASAGTHNFFQSSHVQDVAGTVDGPYLSVDTNSLLYDGGVGYHGAIGGGYAMPVATLVDGNLADSGYGVEDDTTSDNCGGRNLYYLSQDLPVTNSGKAFGYEEHGVGSESWLRSSTVPVILQKAANVTVCQDTPMFSGWK